MHTSDGSRNCKDDLDFKEFDWIKVNYALKGKYLENSIWLYNIGGYALWNLLIYD